MPSRAKQQREMTTEIQGFLENGADDGERFIFLPFLNAVSINLVPAYYGHNVQVERIAITAKFRKVTFSRDVFVDVAVAKAP